MIKNHSYQHPMKGNNTIDLKDYKNYLRAAFPEVVRHATEKSKNWEVMSK